MTTTSTWRLRFTGERPFTLNAERRAHRHERAALVRRWREAFAWLAKLERIPHLDRIAVTATPHLADHRWMQDAGGAFPAAKAAIDGLVDARVVPDDGPAHIVSLTLRAPVVGADDGLELLVEAVVSESAS